MIKIRILASILFLLVACNSGNNTSNTNENPTTDDRIFVSNEQFEKNGMSLIKALETDFPQTISVSGTIDVPPQNKAVITAIMGGYVKNIPLLQGDMVKKGQVLLSVENQEFVRLQQQYLEIQQQLEYLKSEYHRQKTLSEEKIASEKNFLKAQSDYNSALAQLSGLKKQLQLINVNVKDLHFNTISSVLPIYSPIDGNISEILVEQGAFVSATSPLLKVINNEKWLLELTVFEKDAVHLQKDQTVVFKVPEVSKTQQYTAKIVQITTSVDQTRSIKVYAKIDTQQSVNFLSGMFATADIITASYKSFALPEVATAETENGLFVLRLNEKTDKGYYFDQVPLTSPKVNKGFVEVKTDTDTQYLTGKVFELVK